MSYKFDYHKLENRNTIEETMEKEYEGLKKISDYIYEKIAATESSGL